MGKANNCYLADAQIDDLGTDFIEGLEVTELLGIIKYEPKIPACLQGLIKGTFPSFIPKTDEERIQNIPSIIEYFPNVLCYITEKVDGTSGTYYWYNGEFGVCSRNLDLKPDKTIYWYIAEKYNLKQKLQDLNRNIAIQGEIAGEGIQQNHYKLQGQDVFLFSVFDIDKQQYLGYIDLIDIAFKLGLKTVPILVDDFTLEGHTVDSLLELSDDTSRLCKTTIREGIVIRSIENVLGNRISFKVINNQYLLKHEE
jgi:RNA ligase (TIGR02306 family)